MKDNSNKKKIIELVTGLTGGLAVASILVAYRMITHSKRNNKINIKKVDDNSKFNTLHEEIEKALQRSQEGDYDSTILCARRAFEKTLKLIHEEIEKALQRSQKGDYDSTILCARRASEKTLKLIIENAGYEPTNEMCENLKSCEDKKLLDNELIHKLHKVRKICNKNIHEIEAEVSKEDINFVITQTQNLLKEAENIKKYSGI